MLQYNIVSDKTEEKCKDYRRLKIQLYNILSNRGIYCTICLNTNMNFMEIHDEIQICHWKESYSVSMQLILETVFNRTSLDVLGNQICEECRDKAVCAYKFIYNTKHTVDILSDYVTQLNQSIDENCDTCDFTNNTSMVLVLQNPFINQEKIEKDRIDWNHEEQEYLDDEYNKIKNETEPKKMFTCDNCNKTFDTKQKIANHMQQAHMKMVKVKKSRIKNKFTCTECDEIICKHHKYLQAYKDHYEAKNKLITCPDCAYACYLKVDLITHANKVHLKIFSSVCEYCGKPLYSKKQYKIHVFRYHTNKFSCKYCDRYFNVESNLLKHLRKCKQQCSLYLFKCDVCPASFSTQNKLNFHKLRHEIQYPCNLCNKVFTKQILLDQHTTITHAAIKEETARSNFSCLICHEIFPTSKARKEHMARHNSNEKFKCTTCSLEFSTLKSYQIHARKAKHVRKVNPDVQYKHKCNFCSYSTITDQLLEAHVNRHHLKIAPYECKICPRKFLIAKRLESHLAKHEASNNTQQNAYYCEMCGNTFRSLIALQMHIRRHTGEKPYKCDTCEDRFVSASTRNVHKLKAHSEKKFKCPLCDHMTHTLPDMRGHFKKVHWKRKGEVFDIRQVEGLTEEDYELFRDRRLLKL